MKTLTLSTRMLIGIGAGFPVLPFCQPARRGPLAFLPFLLRTLNSTRSCVHFYGHGYLFPGYLLLLSTFQIGFVCKYTLPLQVETEFLGIVVRL